MRTTTKSKRMLAGVATAALLAFPLAACGNDSEGSGDSSSSAAPKPVAVIEALSGDNTAVKLDVGFTDALTALKLTPGVVGPAQLTEDGSLVFPITGGNVSVFEPGSVPNYVVGQIHHEESGFSLTAGDTTVRIINLNVDPGVSRIYADVEVNGERVANSAYVFQLNGSTLKPLQTEGSTAILEGTQVKISDVAAGLLNETFATDAVTAGLLVGIAKITVNTK